MLTLLLTLPLALPLALPFALSLGLPLALLLGVASSEKKEKTPNWGRAVFIKLWVCG